MTKQEQAKLESLTERTARMEQKQEDMAQDITEIKQILKAQDEKFAKFVETAERKFINRIEAGAIAVFITVSISLITLWLNLKDRIH